MQQRSSSSSKACIHLLPFCWFQGLEERLFTYKEVLCSGIQDKQRAVKASYLGLTLPGTTTPAAEGERPFSGEGRPALLQTEDWSPAEELAVVLQELTSDRGAADRLSASLQQAMQDVQSTRSSSSSGEATKRLIADVLNEVMRLAAGKSEAQKAQLLQSVVRLAGRANAEVQADRSSGSRTEQVRRRRQQAQQRSMLHKLLRETCLSGGGSGSPDRLLIFGMEDVEELVAPFSISSLHSLSSNSESSSDDSRLTIGSTFDAADPRLFELAAEKGSADERRRFINAVWWAAMKERLRAETTRSFACPKEGPDGATDWIPCNLGEMQEATNGLIRKLHAQVGGGR